MYDLNSILEPKSLANQGMAIFPRYETEKLKLIDFSTLSVY